MDDQNDSDWRIDRSKNLISHAGGFVAEMSMGQVRNIVSLPPGTVPREISRYVAAAEKAWGGSAGRVPRSDAEGPSAIAALIGNGPQLSRDPKPETTPEAATDYAVPAEKKQTGPTIKIKRRRSLLKDTD